MKKTSFAIAFVVLFTLTLTATAQTQQLAKANIPFSFSVHEQTFTPGMYEVRRLGDGMLRLERVTDHSGVTILTGSTIRQSVAMKLVFHQYGSERYLREIADPVLGFSAPISQSNAERLAGRRLAKGAMLALQTSR
jgi:hypothetical protein